jgi:CheY-like chemotaxis protein/DNA-binding CsgD family transcriptional regulator
MENYKLLIVDDEPLNIVLYIEMFKHSGYVILKASDGLSAIKITSEELPDLVIMDWNMPLMSGLDALKELKAKVETKEIPIIMITGIMTGSENLRTALEEGAIDFLRKPFDKIELLARVKLILMLSSNTKQLKQKFREIESYNRFVQSVIQNISHPLVYYTIDGIILGCNTCFEEVTGVATDALIGTLIYRHFSKEISSLHMSKDIDLIHEGGQIKYEVAGSDGIEFLYSKSVFSDAAGTTQGILCVMTNITLMKKVHRNMLELKKRELVSSALRLIQIGELNNHLVSELATISQYTNKQGSELIRQLIKQNNLKAGEGIWQEFESRFEHVYEDFYKILNHRFPVLTPGEKKLCALLRLNLSTKDIATITFQNPQSVDMARYRLRKKLNLTTDENLSEFLMGLET